MPKGPSQPDGERNGSADNPQGTGSPPGVPNPEVFVCQTTPGGVSSEWWSCESLEKGSPGERICNVNIGQHYCYIGKCSPVGSSKIMV